MYLRAFIDPSQRQKELWRYGPGFKPQPKAPKGVAWEDLFYDAGAELPPEDNDIEDGLAEIETIAAPHLQKLRDGNIDLTPQEKSELATFLSLLITRTRAHREMVNITVSKLHHLGAKETLETPGGVVGLIATNVRLGGEETRGRNRSARPCKRSSTATSSSSRRARPGRSSRSSSAPRTSTSFSSR